jgi:hypothetical protein
MSTPTLTPIKRITLAMVALGYVFFSHPVLASSPLLQAAWVAFGFALVYLLMRSLGATQVAWPRARWMQRNQERTVIDAARVIPSLDVAESV